MPSTGDRRVRRTQKALHGALRDLMIEKRYPAITVTEILDRADVGRSTFYAHYRDKDSLLRDAAQHVTSQIEAALPGDGSLALGPLFQHAAEHAELYRAMSRGPAAPLFLDALRAHLAHRITQSSDLGSSWQDGLRAHYEASAIVGALTWWLEHGRPRPAVDAAELVEKLRR